MYKSNQHANCDKMSNYKSVQEAEEFFRKDLFATTNGVKIDDLTDDYCICSMDVTDKHRNAYGGIMGGAIFTLADYAFAIASNNDHSPTVALDVNIHFMSASKGNHLVAKAERIKNGRTTSIYNVKITDDNGKEVALFIGTGYKL